jgi:hypothetical protein
VLIDNAEDLVNEPTAGVGFLPAGEGLGHRIHLLDTSAGIRGDHAVADTV